MTARATLALLASLLTAAHADTINRVTLSGKATYSQTQPPKIRAKNNTVVTTESTKFKSFSLSNSLILDLMVQLGSIPSKTGYAVVELLNDDGDSVGYYAYRSNGEIFVPIPPAILGADLADPVEQGTTETIGEQRTSFKAKRLEHGFGSILGIDASYHGDSSAEQTSRRVGNLPVVYTRITRTLETHGIGQTLSNMDLRRISLDAKVKSYAATYYSNPANR